MAVDVRNIAEERQTERDEVEKSGPAAVLALELRYIADALEGIRGELVGITHMMATAARERPPFGS